MVKILKCPPLILFQTPMSDVIVMSSSRGHASSNMDHHHHPHHGGYSDQGAAAAAAGSRRSLPRSESFSTTDPAKLSDHELDCLKEAFSLFDADHDGKNITLQRQRKNSFRDTTFLTFWAFLRFVRIICYLSWSNLRPWLLFFRPSLKNV